MKSNTFSFLQNIENRKKVTCMSRIDQNSSYAPAVSCTQYVHVKFFLNFFFSLIQIPLIPKYDIIK